MTEYRRYGPDDGVPLIYLRDPWDAIDAWDPSIIMGLAYARPLILLDRPTFIDSNGEIGEAVMHKAEKAIQVISDISTGQVDLLGFSLGGLVTECVLSTRPDLVRRVILANAITAAGEVGGSPEVDQVCKPSTRFGRVSDWLLEEFFASTELSQAAGHEFLRRLGARAQDWERLEQALHLMQSFAQVSGSQNNQLSTALSKNNHPCLVITGADDTIAPIQKSYALVGERPNTRFIIYPDAGHGAQFQYPDIFVAHVDHFLSVGGNT